MSETGDDDAVTEVGPGSASTFELGDDAADILTVHAGTEPAPAAEAGAPTDRYAQVKRLGAGGMGEVWRVQDDLLNRSLAMKVMRRPHGDEDAARERFVSEAQCSAQLQHPGIVPVHDLGVLPDGRLFFTMREVLGRTLTEAIDEVHAVSRDRWREGAQGWTFRRLVDAVRRVAEAVAYAHGRGVVHRDLKPDNVMVGEHGEVLVVDWGLALVLGVAPTGRARAVQTERSQSGERVTRLGAVAGTPAYMPPEQARGEHDRVDARADVYALGAVLYEVLSGRPPYGGRDADAVVDKVLAGPPPALQVTFDDATQSARGDRDGPPLPGDLVRACERAMARDPAERYADGGGLAAELADWLDGVHRREQALSLVERAGSSQAELLEVRGRAARLRREADSLLRSVGTWEPEHRKLPAWDLEDRSAKLERDAHQRELEVERCLHAALRLVPDLTEAHAALVERWLERHAAVEAARDVEATVRAEHALDEHLAALPTRHPVHRRATAYVRGVGALTLRVEAPETEVLLYRFQQHHRRLVPTFDGSLGFGRLDRVPLDHGSYLCVLRHPGRAEVRYPVHIGRGEHWDGVAPGDREPTVIELPLEDAIAADEVVVPAGWFWSGDAEHNVESLPRRRLWCDTFVMARHPVTNARYLAFLNHLVARGDGDVADRYVPRERPGQVHERGEPVYGRGADGRYELRVDADGDAWQPEWPVLLVDWNAAQAWCRWWSGVTGQAWRLPGELEWEKAARGVDGRAFPWGDRFDASWAAVRQSFPARPQPQAVSAFPVDESVYGVRGLGGNAQDWCADAFELDGVPVVGERVPVPAPPAEDSPSDVRRVARGGCWNGSERHARSATRLAGQAGYRSGFLGFRPVRS